jgi:very-short-patch-repair endonuclease
MRITNEEIFEDIDKVMQKILTKLS